MPKTSIAQIAAALCVAAMVLPGSGVGWAATMRDTFIWGKAGDADTLDAPVTTSGETGEVVRQIFNVLVRPKPGGTEVEPDLATSWSVSPDGLVWTFTLRQGVRFHDGTPWNAEAAKFNFDRWADDKNPYHPVKERVYEFWSDFMADAFKEAKAVDPETLQLVLKQPNAPLIYNLSIITFDFASPASIKQYGADGVGLHPVGTGPYKFVEWLRDDHVTLEANPTFFRPGLPKTKRLVMRVIKDNSARFLALKANEIQAMELPAPDDVKAAAGDPTLKVGYRPPFNTGWIRFNMNNNLFKDKRVRQAFALAINKEQIVKGLYGGYGEVAGQLLPPGMWGRSSKAHPYPYDPAKAKQLLSGAGYPDGLSVDFWYVPISRPFFPSAKEIGTAICSDLAKVDVKCTLMTEDWGAYLNDVLHTNKFPIFMIGQVGDTGDPDDWLGFFYAKSDPNSALYSYHNQTVLDLVARARMLMNHTDRAKAYGEIADITYDDVRDIPLAYAKVPLLMRKNVVGLVGQPNGIEYMDTVELK
jgi:peptide/nickel transport system substrate-binding protein